MKSEIWKPHPVYNNYLISSLGRVRHVKSESFRKFRLNSGGYLRFNIKVAPGKTKTIMVHQAVAETFLTKPGENYMVCHGDGDRFNNAVSNLRYDTSQANVMDAVKHGTHSEIRKTHCPRGHAYDENNTYRRKTGARSCRACGRINVRNKIKPRLLILHWEYTSCSIRHGRQSRI